MVAGTVGEIVGSVVGTSMGLEIVGADVFVPVGPFGALVRAPVGESVGKVGLPSTSVGEIVGADVSVPVGPFGAGVRTSVGVGALVGEEVGSSYLGCSQDGRMEGAGLSSVGESVG